MLKRGAVARDFYPFVEEGSNDGSPPLEVRCPARIAVYDDAAAAPRVVIVDPTDVRSFLEEVTATVNRLAREQGGTIPFMVIREIVENYVHAYFASPIISILDNGNTIRFSDQGPGIADKELALEYGTTSATEEMKRYIRGVGSGLPYAQQYMTDKGGSLEIEDNINGGTVVTISVRPAEDARAIASGKARQREHQSVQTAQETTTTSTTDTPNTVTLPEIQLSERERQALALLASKGETGPTDLTKEYGLSGPTWSRVLQSLAREGLATKTGQKYELTEIGRQIAST